MKPLPREYYLQPDPLFLSKDLLGKYLYTKFDHQITGGMIIETEAYIGPNDKASHAYNGRRTKRNEAMYWKGGIAYVYLCYGIHALFNVVTHYENIPHAILIRSLHPTDGIDIMLHRRKKKKFDTTLTGGPGSLTQALGINKNHNAIALSGPEIWIEDKGINMQDQTVQCGPRIGIEYAKEDALLPWRFWIRPKEF